MKKRFRATIWYFGKNFIISAGAVFPFFFLPPVWQAWRDIWTAFSPLRLALVLFSVALLVFALVSLGRFLLPFWYIRKVREHDREIERGRVTTYDGAPGVGKTLSMTYDGVILAQFSESELWYDYIMNGARLSAENCKDINDFWKVATVRETAEFLADTNGMGILFANYPIEVDGLLCCKLTKEHFLQRERLPERAVVLLDESADLFPCSRHNEKRDSEAGIENAIYNETFSKERHYFNGYILANEQDNKENYIGLRRVVSCNRYLHAREEVCRPNRLIRRFERRKRKILKRGYADYSTYRKMSRLKAKIDKIGFMKIYFLDLGNTEKPGAELGEGYFVLPMNLPFKYETRAHQFAYKALTERIRAEVFESLYLRPEDVLRDSPAV